MITACFFAYLSAEINDVDKFDFIAEVLRK